MESYQERLLSEKTELDSKIALLEQFIGENEIAAGRAKFKSLSREERFALKTQLLFMQGYADVLGQRISFWD